MVAPLLNGCVSLYHQTSSCVACLLDTLTADDVQYKTVAWDLLVGSDFNYVTSLDASPVIQLETPRALGEGVLLTRFFVDEVSCFLQFAISQDVHQSCGKEGEAQSGDDMGVLAKVILAGSHNQIGVQYEDQVVQGKDQIVDEPQQADIALLNNTYQNSI